MKNLTLNWNLRRIIYLLGGLFFIAIAVNDRSWWMIPIGLYFAGMAVFKLGCVAGNCTAPFSQEKDKA